MKRRFNLLTNKRANSRRMMGVLITVVIIALLLLSGPANAFDLILGAPSDATPLQGVTITFTATMEVFANELVPISNLSINMSDGTLCYFDILGNILTPADCNGITITPDENTMEYAAGNMDFNFSGTPYNYGPGFGYGYAAPGPSVLTYNISLDTGEFAPGPLDFSLNAIMTNAAVFTSDSQSINIGVDTEAPTYTTVATVDTDSFYSPSSGVVNIIVNATDASSGIAQVVANFKNISATACGGTGLLTLTLNITTGLYNGSCNVASFITSGQMPTTRLITVNITDNVGISNTSAPPIIILLQDLGMPSMGANPCMRFGSSTTNFSTVPNFNAVNFVMSIQGNLSCMTGNPALPSSWADMLLINLTSVNLGSKAAAEKLAGLSTAMNVSIQGPGSFGNSRIYINSTYFSELNTTATIKLFNLPFQSMPAIVGDASAAGVNGTNQLTWASAYNAALGVYTGNLTFQVKGFSGYNVTDNSTPIIAFIDPTQSMNLSATSRNINFTVNGTGTQVSYVTLVVDSMPALIYNATTGAQGLNCTAATPGSEKLACNATVNLTNGTHTLTVTAYDYGGTAGNIKISAITFTTDTTAPTITINNPNTDPAQSKTLTASTSDGTLTMNITTGSACNSSLTFAAYAITTFTSESDNGKKICYKAVDAASNTAYSMSSAISGIDATAPVVSLISPNNSITWTSSTSPVHHFNVSDSISSTFNCTVFLTGSVINASYNRADVANSSSDGDIDFGFWYGLNNGNVTWHVNCTDAVGNTGTSASRWYYVNDTTAPDITDSSYSCTMSGSECTSSTTSVGISVTTDEDATCKYDTEDVVYDDMADLFTTTGGTTHEETYEVDDGEDYLIYVRCEDDYSNQNDASTEISFSVKKKSSGAGGGSSAPPNPSTTMGWSQMAPGTTSIMRITNEELGLTKIIIEVNSPTQNVKIIIEKLPGKPATITKIITGKVFNYLKITKLNLDDALISGNAKVQFKIPLSWLTSNGVDPKNIALKRFADNDWQDLKTTLLSTDSKYAYYESETPGFSYFAIGEKSAELTPVPKPAEEPATTTTTETGTGAATTTPEKKPATTQPEKQPAAATTTTKSKPAVQVTIVVIVVIAIGLIILTSTGRKKKGLRHIDEING